jgi:GTPase SAR1 family protein
MLNVCGLNRGTPVQFLLVGPPKCGKTTLVFRLKLGNHWKREEMFRDFKRMEAAKQLSVHYEEFSRLKIKRTQI